MTKLSFQPCQFGPFHLDPGERLLARDGETIPLSPRAFETLLVLIRERGHLVAKGQLMSEVWPDSFVEEANVTVTISVLRKALGDDPQKPKYIQTVSKSGYRFVGEVHPLEIEAHVREVELAPSVLPPASLASPVQAIPWYGHISRLGWIAALILVIACLTLTGAVFLSRQLAARRAIKSMAVLPFRNLNGDLAHDYLGVGMSDALITKLGRTSSIIVRPTSSVLKYANGSADPMAAGREQGVDAILDGRIQTAGDRLRITAQLIRVSDGSSIWAGAFDQSPQESFKLEDSIAESIVASLSGTLPRRSLPGRNLSGGENRATPRPIQAVNSRAFEFYMRGRYFWNRRTEDSLQRAIGYFQQAIAEDPNYALAYAGLADSYALMASFSVQPGQQANPSGKAAALKAIQLDGSLAEPHASLGMLSFFSEWEGLAAEGEFQKALALNQNYATAHHWYGLDLAAMGRLPEALSEVRRAKELDPLSLIINTNVGWMFYLSRRYDEAIVEFRKALELDPDFPRARTRLGITYMQKGDWAAATRELEEALRLSGRDPYIAGVLGDARARAGDQQGARRILKELESRSKQHYVPPFGVALIYIGLGQRNEALQWLNRAYDDHSTSMVYAKVDPILDPVRSDPRFSELLSRMKF